jgi:hypothetical protein
MSQFARGGDRGLRADEIQSRSTQLFEETLRNIPAQSGRCRVLDTLQMTKALKNKNKNTKT